MYRSGSYHSRSRWPARDNLGLVRLVQPKSRILRLLSGTG
nr:MAG TPA: hypothetical protein [Caudoviricetes sp.]DAZ77214.1 MAG TPA: hypothetical protein [Caudoviricetes sp.]